MNRSNIMNVHLVHRGVLIYPLMAAIVRFCVATSENPRNIYIAFGYRVTFHCVVA